MSPRVSVCIPVYNPGDFLCDAIRSVLEQDFSEYELIIVDDGSAESPAVTVTQFPDPRIQFHSFDHNVGLPENWNRCIDLSGGEYITILHQDDLMLAGSLGQKIAFLDRNPSVGFVYSDILAIDEQQEVIGRHRISQPERSSVFAGCEFYRLVSETGNPVACSSVVVRATCYELLGNFDSTLPFAPDLEMWLRIAAHFDVGFISVPLNAQRFHENQETTNFQQTGRDYLDVMRAFDRIPIKSVPYNCARYLTRCYQTLSKQALPMARWQIRQGKPRSSMLYGLVAIMAFAKSVWRSIAIFRFGDESM